MEIRTMNAPIRRYLRFLLLVSVLSAISVTQAPMAKSIKIPKKRVTREQFREEHGASTADLTSIQEFARSQNLRIVEVNAMQRSVKLIT